MVDNAEAALETLNAKRFTLINERDLAGGADN
jgi:hypothetical protein